MPDKHRQKAGKPSNTACHSLPQVFTAHPCPPSPGIQKACKFTGFRKYLSSLELK
jgi:hypothetical protein